MWFKHDRKLAVPVISIHWYTSQNLIKSLSSHRKLLGSSVIDYNNSITWTIHFQIGTADNRRNLQFNLTFGQDSKNDVKLVIYDRECSNGRSLGASGVLRGLAPQVMTERSASWQIHGLFDNLHDDKVNRARHGTRRKIIFSFCHSFSACYKNVGSSDGNEYRRRRRRRKTFYFLVLNN